MLVLASVCGRFFFFGRTTLFYCLHRKERPQNAAGNCFLFFFPLLKNRSWFLRLHNISPVLWYFVFNCAARAASSVAFLSSAPSPPLTFFFCILRSDLLKLFASRFTNCAALFLFRTIVYMAHGSCCMTAGGSVEL